MTRKPWTTRSGVLHPRKLIIHIYNPAHGYQLSNSFDRPFLEIILHTIICTTFLYYNQFFSYFKYFSSSWKLFLGSRVGWSHSPWFIDTLWTNSFSRVSSWMILFLWRNLGRAPDEGGMTGVCPAVNDHFRSRCSWIFVLIWKVVYKIQWRVDRCWEERINIDGEMVKTLNDSKYFIYHLIFNMGKYVHHVHINIGVVI